VETSHNFRLGSYRLRKMLDETRAPVARQKEILTSHVKRLTEQIYSSMVQGDDVKLLLLGSEARFAAACLSPAWDKKDIVKLDVSALSGLIDKLVKMSPDEIVTKHHISFSEAETMAPALLSCIHLAQQYKNKTVYVGTANVRNGMLVEMTSRDTWGDMFKQQIVNSALEIGKKYSFDQHHAEHVADMSIKLFNAMKDEHKLGSRYMLILRIAALLHDIGDVVNNRSHHKHSMYLILNSDIFGLSAKDLMLTAMIARYHRRSTPKPGHPEFTALDRDDKIVVLKLAAILRVADALDRGHVQTGWS
jgi:exopolyphosphatase/guanosine-5'-triphosphate,3'-diphosphate pyrophosphatase